MVGVEGVSQALGSAAGRCSRSLCGGLRGERQAQGRHAGALIEAQRLQPGPGTLHSQSPPSAAHTVNLLHLCPAC